MVLKKIKIWHSVCDFINKREQSEIRTKKVKKNCSINIEEDKQEEKGNGLEREMKSKGGK